MRCSFKNIFKLFFPYLLQSKTRALITVSLLLLETGVALILPFILKNVVENLEHASFSMILLLIGGFCFFWLMEKVLSDLQEILFFPVINNAIKNITYKLVDHLHALPLQKIQQSNAKVLSSMKRISQSARSFIKVFFLQIPVSVLSLVGACSILIRYHALCLLIFIPLGLIGIVLIYSLRWYSKERKRAWRWTDWTSEALFDSLFNTKLARYHQKFEMNRVGEYLEKEANFWVMTNTKLHWMSIFITGLFGLSVFIGLFIFLQTDLTVAEFILVKGLILATYLPIRNLSRQIRQIFESIIDVENIQQIFSLSKESFSTRKIPFTRPSLECRDVTFSYPNEHGIFKDLNLSVAFGKKVLITGGSGAGKSTLCHLLAGLTLPQKGEIYFGEAPLYRYPKSDLGESMVFIPQKIHLLNASIFENLTYGCPSLPFDRIEEVLHIVDLYELIIKLPDQIHTVVGEQGQFLSGGECQRIALARVLLMEPQVMILDEATQSLDIKREEKIFEEIARLDATVIVVSHRMESKYFDEHVHIEQKQLQQIETRPDLLVLR